MLALLIADEHYRNIWRHDPQRGWLVRRCEWRALFELAANRLLIHTMMLERRGFLMVKTKTTGLIAATVALATGSAFLIGVNQSAGASAPDQASHKSRVVGHRVGSDVFGVPVEIAPGNNGLAIARCPRGTTLSGGGGVTSGFNIFFTDSYRSGPRKWTVRGTNNPPTAGGTETLTAFARCL